MGHLEENKQTAGGRSWLLSFLPHLANRWRQRVVLLLLAATLLTPGKAWGQEKKPNPKSQIPNNDANPAVQKALHQLGLSAPLSPSGGADFQVNSYTTGDQNYAAVAIDVDGDFVVVWDSIGSIQPDTDRSIQAQLFDETGAAVGSQFRVNSSTNNDQRRPAIAMDNAGNFVVVWQNSSIAADTNYSIQARRFNSAGTPLAAQFRVNTYTTGDQEYPSVAMDSDGDFVIVWQSARSGGNDTSSTSIQGQRYNNSGVGQGQFEINDFTTDLQRNPAVSMDNSGNFVVVWDSLGSPQGDGTFSIQAKRYNSSGTAQGGQFQVNDYSTGDQGFPAVALDDDGDFVVAWESITGTGDTYYGIHARRFNSVGTAQGSQFRVNSYTTDEQRSPAVTIDSDGDFAVVWQSIGSSGSDDDDYSIQGRAYNRNGVPMLAEFQVNSVTTGYQQFPAVAMDISGDFTVVWHSYASAGSDLSDSIQMQQIAFDPTAVTLAGAEVKLPAAAGLWAGLWAGLTGLLSILTGWLLRRRR